MTEKKQPNAQGQYSNALSPNSQKHNLISTMAINGESTVDVSTNENQHSFSTLSSSPVHLKHSESITSSAVPSRESEGTAENKRIKNHHRSSDGRKEGKSSNNKARNKSRSESVRHRNFAVPAIAGYIPSYLRQFVFPYHGDFCFSHHFNAQLLVQLMAEGFLPMCSHDLVLLPKLHQQRSCIRLSNNTQHNGGGLHTGKSTRKKAKNFTLTFNQCWNEVVNGCLAQHGDHCWLYPPLLQSFEAIHNAGAASVQALGDDKTANRAPFFATLATPAGIQKVPVRLHSVELWTNHTKSPGNDDENRSKNERGEDAKNLIGNDRKSDEEAESNEPRLVAGEIGYTVGAVYTSLTGFTTESSAGSIQLAALGSALKLASFQVWDLGMDMPYKQNLGANLLQRTDFLGLVHENRVKSECNLVQRQAFPGRNAREIIDEAASLS